MSAFEEPMAQRLRQTVESAPLERSEVGTRERELWLRSQLAVPPRLLPGERADGHPIPQAPQQALVLDPKDVIGESETGPAPLICPLDLRPRSAAALVGFLANAAAPLAVEALPISRDAVRDRITAVMGELAGQAAHVVSSTWTVPLPWFALVEPDARQLVLAPMDDPERQCYWRAPMADARRRVARAHQVVSERIGAHGPAQLLADTERWLDHFDTGSAIELDYGGLVQLLGDESLREDTTASDVHAIVDALEAGDAEEVAERYTRLRDFWGDLAARERTG